MPRKSVLRKIASLLKRESPPQKQRRPEHGKPIRGGVGESPRSRAWKALASRVFPEIDVFIVKDGQNLERIKTIEIVTGQGDRDIEQ